jgi:DNA polymerase-3 subunit epsilon
LKLLNPQQTLAFVDLETTGTSCTKDRITEIGIVFVSSDGLQEWTQLVNPCTRIPAYIEQITGISNAMVTDAPTFEKIASNVRDLLEGCLFIAHNARFDYGFLKNEFKRLDIPFSPTVLCTVKLSRKLYPEYRHHNLNSIIDRHHLTTTDRHRALGDAQLIHQFWQHLTENFEPDLLNSTVNKLIQRSSLPSHIDPLLVYDLPERSGVYLFYGENNLPIYIGKSVNIKQRVLSHFSADHRHNKEMNLSQQLRRIDWIETAGELGALLTEAKLIKELMPVYNQRLRRKNDLCAWQLIQTDIHLNPMLAWANDLEFGHQDNLYGLYRNQRDAHKALRAIAVENQLCLSALGLEKTLNGKPCFAYQLKKCRGACVGKETPDEHAIRLRMAMVSIKINTWPYEGAIGIQEATDLHIIDNWCYLGTAKSKADIKEILSAGKPLFDRDNYVMLSKALQNKPVIKLDRHVSEHN